jgi:hypothetical protein
LNTLVLPHIAGGATGSEGAVLPIWGEQEFPAHLKREG